VPGAAQEAAAFDGVGRAHGVCIAAFGRFTIDTGLQGDQYFRQLAADVGQLAAGKPVVFVGFSIGAFVALQTSRHYAGPIAALHLVSAAAPLQAGDFLEAMAGKPVFQLAQSSPITFALLCFCQGLLARWFPAILVRMLFASAVASDRRLAQDPAFGTAMAANIRSCFVDQAPGYIRDIGAYVKPWADTLLQVKVPVTLWHGAQDNWSPPAMATYLQSALPCCQAVQSMAGVSHYGCLFEAIPQICAMAFEDLRAT
jgi:pimeloyl-ACP methyl ester carboxylesterase